MANVGTAAAGKTLIGAGVGSSPTYASIGTNSGLTAHGVVLSEGNSAFSATSTGTLGQVLTSNGPGADPSFQTLLAAGSLTPDSGSVVSAVAGTIPTLGYQAGTVQTTRTYNDGAGNFRIADQTWYTQYVVDASTTPGLKGTFQTIQAALNQAVSDGMVYNQPRVIYIRVGTYTEDLVIPGGAILVGETLSNAVGAITNPLNTVIVGSHTFSGTVIWGANNLIFETTTGDMFNGTGAAIIVGCLDNCTILNIGSGQIINAMPASSSFDFTGSAFYTSFEASQFTCTNMVYMGLFECTCMTTMNINVDGCSLTARNVTGMNTTVGITVTLGTGGSIYASQCNFATASAQYCIDGSGSNGGVLYECSFANASTAGIKSGVGNFILRNCNSATSLYYPLFQDPATTSINPTMQGNILSSTLTATDLNVTVNMYYIGVTSTAAARTINLVDGTGSSPIQLPTSGQVFIIKDQSGGAATNNITVTTQGGTVTIDGATTALINTNYGSLTFKFDGTNYFIL